jgi:putative Ca2+/H+ antiporter (TMEM165/GDT1 family)
MALLLAVPQLVFLRAKPAPKEPTWSFGAMLIVLLVAQICDAGRLMVLALTLYTDEPVFVAAGGALGSGLALLTGCLAGTEWERRVPHSTLSQGIGAVLLAVALSIGTFVR